MLWWSPLPPIPLVAPEDNTSEGHGIIAAALEEPLLPNDQQKVSACYLHPVSAVSWALCHMDACDPGMHAPSLSWPAFGSFWRIETALISLRGVTKRGG